MPRPNKQWERRYGKDTFPAKKEVRLEGEDSIFSAVQKLGGKVPEAEGILFRILRNSNRIHQTLLHMDGMQFYGWRIVRAFHTWAGNDGDKLLKGVEDNDPSLRQFINNTPAS